jgi:putative transposase
MTAHLGYEKHDPAGYNSGNSRNGKTKKKLKGSLGRSKSRRRGTGKEIYGTEVSPAFISQVTEQVQDEVRAWQNRPLDAVYPIVYLDALYVKMRDSGHVQNRAVYVAIGVNLEGQKEANPISQKPFQRPIVELERWQLFSDNSH